MKKIILGNIELIIDNNNLFVMRKRLIKIDNNWEIENYQETLCFDINLECKSCIYDFDNKCNYQTWFPGLKEGRNDK
jgi:hypothetical protein